MTASMRFTAFDFDASKYDAMLSDVNNLDGDRLKAISGLVGTRAVRTQKNRMMVVSNYSSMEALDAANDAHSSIFAVMTPVLALRWPQAPRLSVLLHLAQPV